MEKIRKISICILSFLLALSLACLVGCEMDGAGVSDSSSGAIETSSNAIETSSGDISSGDVSGDPQSGSNDTQSSVEPETSSVEPETSSVEPQSSSDGSSSGGNSSSDGSEPVIEPERTVTVTFSAGNGSANTIVEGKPGDLIMAPADPVREGYAFDGWELNGEEALLIFPENDVTLNAIWVRLVKVTFSAGNGTPNTVVEGKPGDLIMAPVDPVRDGYVFAGWGLNGEAVVLIFPENDVTLSAIWAHSVTVHFDTGTSDVTVRDMTVDYGATITEPTVSRAGYLLRRWTYRNAAFDFSTPLTSDITLTAEWLERTNLATMSIELFNEDGSTFNIYDIRKENYVTSSITLTDGDGELELDRVGSGMKGRGNGSWSTPSSRNDPKNGYKLKLDKKKSLFGREANKHWVLLACTNFEDVTMCRNYTAYNMAGEIFDGMEYVTNVVWVDLFVNGEYRGVYDLCEHVRVAAGRVDIESEYGVNDTGYLIEYDAYSTPGSAMWTSTDPGTEGIDYFSINDPSSSSGGGGGGNPWGGWNPGGGGSSSSNKLVKYNFAMHSPSPEDYATEGKITEERYREQVSFIQDYVKRTYASIITDKNFTTFASLADVDSFVDMYILQELYKNTDAGYSSFYLYKKPNGGKLYAGPAWDFDGTTTAARNSGQATGIFVADPNDRNTNTKSELLIDLYANTEFRALVNARWQQISPSIKAYYDDMFNDEFYATYGDAMAKNFYRWRSGSSGGGNPWGGGGSSGGNNTLESAKTTWTNNMRTLGTWFNDRINYLNGIWK